MEILIILALILLNGIFSMSEIAIVSSRKTRLDSAAKRGDKRARIALDTATSPNRFLSTVQIGITLIGILTGMFTGEGMATSLQAHLTGLGMDPSVAQPLSVVMVVVFVTYLSLVLGELLPKRIGLINPEGIAKTVAGPMKLLTAITAPFVWLLTISSDLLIRVFRIKPSPESRVTEEEIKAIIQEGRDVGEIQDIEQDIVERVFNLGDRTISSLMTHRNETVVVGEHWNIEQVKDVVLSEMHSFYPVLSSENDEQVVGVLMLPAVVLNFSNDSFRVRDAMEPALYFAENTTAYDALIQFKKQNKYSAIVVDEFGHMQGVVTLNDLLQSLAGDVSEFHAEEFVFSQREDGSWLIDGQYPLADFLSRFEMDEFIAELPFNTLAGLLLDQTRSIPVTGQVIHWNQFEFEVVDMDYARIDKVICRVVRS